MSATRTETAGMTQPVQVLPPVTPAGVKLEEIELLRMDSLHKDVVIAQMQFEKAESLVRDAQELRKQTITKLQVYRAQLENKYKVNLGPGTVLHPDGRVVSAPQAPVQVPLTAADFPSPEDLRRKLQEAEKDS